MPSEEEALRKKEEELAVKEAIKQEEWLQQLALDPSLSQGGGVGDEELDKEFESLQDTKLNQLFNKMRARQAKEDQQRAGKQ